MNLCGPSAPNRTILRTVALLLFLICLPGMAQAQWTTSGSNVTTSSNVGIGPTTPDYPLTISSTSANLQNFYRNGMKIGTIAASNNDFNLVAETGDMALFVTGGRKFSFTGGNVSIGGVSNPFGKLYVGDNTGATVSIATNNSPGSIASPLYPTLDFLGYLNQGRARIRAAEQTTNTYGSTLSFHVNDGSGPNALVERMTILQNGNVGIGGIASPVGKLYVGDGAGATISIATNNNNGSATAPLYPTLDFLGYLNGNRARIRASEKTENSYGSTLSFLVNDASGPAALVERMTILQDGNVGVGLTVPSYKLHVQGDATTGQVMGLIGADRNWSLVQGGSTAPTGGFGIRDNFSNVTRLAIDASGNVQVEGAIHANGAITGTTVNATYQDVAEWVATSKDVPVATVVVLDPNHSNQVTTSFKGYDTRVAGVVSAKPGLVLGEGGAGRAMIATVGRVKVKVDATRQPIHVGDLLVTGTLEGTAMKSVPVNIGGVEMHRPGTLIGKALESLEKGTGEILILLSLQ